MSRGVARWARPPDPIYNYLFFKQTEKGFQTEESPFFTVCVPLPTPTSVRDFRETEN